MSYKNQENPTEKSCFRSCAACFRCEDKGRYAKCSSCSGRHDPDLIRDPYDIDDRCRCSEGILQIRTREGRFIQTKYPGNPYKGSVQFEKKTQDELDWEAYLYEMRSKFDDPDWDPITIEGESETNRTRKLRGD